MTWVTAGRRAERWRPSRDTPRHAHGIRGLARLRRSLDDGGPWRVAEGIHRIPLPLPTDGLKAVNVYVIETDDGLTLIDGGWAIEVAREVLECCLRQLGAGFGDIRRFLVTHVHRDHFTMATVLGAEYGAEVMLGADEKPALDFLNDGDRSSRGGFSSALVSAGAADLAARWNLDGELPDSAMWRYPNTWLEGDHSIPVGTRSLEAVHTPGWRVAPVGTGSPRSGYRESA